MPHAPLCVFLICARLFGWRAISIAITRLLLVRASLYVPTYAVQSTAFAGNFCYFPLMCLTVGERLSDVIEGDAIFFDADGRHDD